MAFTRLAAALNVPLKVGGAKRQPSFRQVRFAGCADYHTKPVDFPKLLDQIEAVLQQRQP